MTRTTLLLAVLIGTSTAAPAADLWRMYRCTGDRGETAFSDRRIGTDCVEIWLSPQPRDGWTITDPSVNQATKEQPQ
ncbi:MAG: hypothetical protein EOM26_14120 [Alphaproteobacteria bacterium]|nr:hypothetical protein [Alphaproteobacteria bacterium]